MGGSRIAVNTYTCGNRPLKLQYSQDEEDPGDCKGSASGEPGGTASVSKPYMIERLFLGISPKEMY
jgi:hypothetical protein